MGTNLLVEFFWWWAGKSPQIPRFVSQVPPFFFLGTRIHGTLALGTSKIIIWFIRHRYHKLNILVMFQPSSSNSISRVIIALLDLYMQHSFIFRHRPGPGTSPLSLAFLLGHSLFLSKGSPLVEWKLLTSKFPSSLWYEEAMELSEYALALADYLSSSIPISMV